MAKNKIELEITQENGFIRIYRNGEYEQGYDFNRDCSPIATANMVAEIIYDCLNCKNVKPKSLKDLNDSHAYRGSYFEGLDFYAD